MGTTRMALTALAVMIALGGLGEATSVRAEQGPDTPPCKTRGPGPKGKWSPAERLARMTERLDLTEAQQAAIRPILEEEANRFKALRDDTTLDRSQKKAKIRAIAAGAFERINDILTPEQRAKHDEMRKKARDRWEDRRRQTPPGADRK